MYAETLYVPHERKTKPLSTRERLLDKVDIAAIRHELSLASATSLEAYNQCRVEAADAIAKDVNAALWFPMRTHGSDDFAEFDINWPVQLESLESKQMTDCFGYSIVTSEILSECSIKHWLAYANGHMFLAIPPASIKEADSCDVYLLDPLSPHLNQYMGDALVRGTVEELAGAISSGERGVAMIDAERISHNVGHSYRELALKHGWLVHDNGGLFKGRDIFFNGDESKDYAQFLSQKRIIMSVFGEDVGRHMIEEYVEFRAAVANNDIESACVGIKNMSGVYPEIDARQSHEEIKVIVDALCKNGNSILAVQVVEEYFDSNFSVSGDSRLPEAKGDFLRRIFRYSDDDRVREKAVDAYSVARTNPRCFKERLVGKLAVLESAAK